MNDEGSHHAREFFFLVDNNVTTLNEYVLDKLIRSKSRYSCRKRSTQKQFFFINS